MDLTTGLVLVNLTENLTEPVSGISKDRKRPAALRETEP